MMFFFRAALWLAVVSVFVPSDFAGDAMDVAELDLPFNTSETQLDAGVSVSEWCAEHATICEAGEEAARLGSFVSEVAIARIEDAIAEREESDA